MERKIYITKPNGIVVECYFNKFKSVTAFVYLIGQEDPVIIRTKNIVEGLIQQYKEFLKGNDTSKYFGYYYSNSHIDDVTNYYHKEAYEKSIKNGSFDVDTFLKEKTGCSVEWEEKHFNLEQISHIEVKSSSTCEKGTTKK